MSKTAIYARVSSEDQQERGTIENQLDFARKYCDLHQLEIFDWYKDDGVTGTLPLESRESGKRLLEDAKAGLFDMLLIYKLDRLGRSARIILNGVYELEQYGVKIRSMTEPFDTGDPSGRFLLTILAGVADLERETILERLWYGANRAARNGKWLGGIIPYGYRVNEEKHLEINEDPLPGLNMSEADVVRLIYRLIANQGFSTIKVADYLNALGIPPAYAKDGRQITRGKRKVNTAGIWRPGRIYNIIINTTYKGIHRYGKRTKKDREIILREVPPIVSEETWEKAQRTLQDNQLEGIKNSKRSYLLRGLIKCNTCGLTYHGTAYHGPQGNPKGYYVCGGKSIYRGPLDGKCYSKNISQQWIEDLIWNECVGFINNPGEALKQLYASMQEKKSQKIDVEKDMDIIRNVLNDKEFEKQSILDLYRKKLINSTDVEQQLQKITQEKLKLEQQLRELEQLIDTEENLAYKFSTVEDLLSELRKKLKEASSFSVRRQIVKTLVKEIKIDTQITEFGRPVGTVTVCYSFSQDVIRTDKGSLKRPALLRQER